MKINSKILTLSVLLASGCATTIPTSSEVQQAPQNRIYFVSEKPSAETAKIIVTRDSGTFGSGNFFHLYIDGKKAASLDPAENVELTIRSGEHTFGVKPTDPFGLAATESIDQDLKPGRVYRYRILYSASGWRIQRVLE